MNLFQLIGFTDFTKSASSYDVDIWRSFCNLFNCLPISAIVENKIFCIHGGLSPLLNSMSQIENFIRPMEVPEDGLLCDLLWSDPTVGAEDWEENDRGTGICFGVRKVEAFCQKFHFDLICRAHQAVMDGYEFPFPDSQSVVTVFSAPNYCYEYDNRAAILHVDKDLYCSFTQIEPIDYHVIRPTVDERCGTPPRNDLSDEDDLYFRIK